METLKKIKGINYDINKRWEKGIEHHTESIKLYDRLEDLDLYVGNDLFCFKSGGDGDNGEHLMFLLDIIFEEKDTLKEKLLGKHAEHPIITRKWFMDNFEEITEAYMNGETAEDIVYDTDGDITKIYFAVNCGRAGITPDNIFTINNKTKKVEKYFQESPIEGCEVEETMLNDIKLQLRKTK